MTAATRAPATITGVLGGSWRADVTTTGDVLPWDGSAPLTWHVAADDRWHTPSIEPSVRQSLIEGTPVVETRLRIPDGDAVQRVWSVADHGGLTVVEVENDSPLPIAVAFTRRDLLSARPPTEMPLEGIDLPAGSVAFPVGHHSTVTVALAHDGRGAGTLPGGLPPAMQVARGWLAMCERAGRFVLPDDVLVAAVTTARCAVALGGPGDPEDDPATFLVGVGQLVRMGEDAEPWLPDVARAAERVARAARRGGGWLTAAALDACADAFDAAADALAAGDLVALRRRLTIDATLPDDALGGIVGAAWLERRLADPAGRLLAGGLPAAWLGATVEAYGLPIGQGATVSYALRWHGERPAVLWEVVGRPVTLTAPAVAPAWSSSATSGEALWPAPPGAELLHLDPTEPFGTDPSGPGAASGSTPPPPSPPPPEDGGSFS